MKIEVGKRYRTRQGEIVLIEQEGHPAPGGGPLEFYQFSGYTSDGSLEGWRSDGRFFEHGDSCLDLAEEVPESEECKSDELAAPGAITLKPVEVHSAEIPLPSCSVNRDFSHVREARASTPADIAAITAIEQAMRDLGSLHQSAVIAWFCSRYPAAPF